MQRRLKFGSEGAELKKTLWEPIFKPASPCLAGRLSDDSLGHAWGLGFIMKRKDGQMRKKKRRLRRTLKKIAYVAPAIIGSFLLTEAMAQTPSSCTPTTLGNCPDGSAPPCN